MFARTARGPGTPCIIDLMSGTKIRRTFVPSRASFFPPPSRRLVEASNRACTRGYTRRSITHRRIVARVISKTSANSRRTYSYISMIESYGASAIAIGPNVLIPPACNATRVQKCARRHLRLLASPVCRNRGETIPERPDRESKSRENAFHSAPDETASRDPGETSAKHEIYPSPVRICRTFP